jgi:hypothetical protein
MLFRDLSARGATLPNCSSKFGGLCHLALLASLVLPLWSQGPGSVWHKAWNGADWDPPTRDWVSLDGVVQADPVVITSGRDRLEIGAWQPGKAAPRRREMAKLQRPGVILRVDFASLKGGIA